MAHNIAVVVFEGVSPFHISVPCIVFGDELLKLEAPRYKVLLCADKAGAVTTLSGFEIVVPYDLNTITAADTVIIPAWRDTTEPPPQALVDALHVAYNRGARIVGLCLGSFILASAGLLDGRKATTHWAWADEFRRHFPNVQLDANALYIEDGPILTSAGTAAAIDCCLHLVRRDHGAEMANRIARRLVVAPQRYGSQAQYIEMPIPISGSRDQLTATLEWALEHLTNELSLEILAQHACMSVRSFTRHFRLKTGTSVAQWLLNHRLFQAQQLLETDSCSIDDVASKSGFSSTVAFRKHFTRFFSVPPAAYRKQYQARESTD